MAELQLQHLSLPGLLQQQLFTLCDQTLYEQTRITHWGNHRIQMEITITIMDHHLQRLNYTTSNGLTTPQQHNIVVQIHTPPPLFSPIPNQKTNQIITNETKPKTILNL